MQMHSVAILLLALWPSLAAEQNERHWSVNLSLPSNGTSEASTGVSLHSNQSTKIQISDPGNDHETSIAITGDATEAVRTSGTEATADSELFNDRSQEPTTEIDSSDEPTVVDEWSASTADTTIGNRSRESASEKAAVDEATSGAMTEADVQMDALTSAASETTSDADVDEMPAQAASTSSSPTTVSGALATRTAGALYSPSSSQAETKTTVSFETNLHEKSDNFTPRDRSRNRYPSNPFRPLPSNDDTSLHPQSSSSVTSSLPQVSSHQSEITDETTLKVSTHLQSSSVTSRAPTEFPGKTTIPKRVIAAFGKIEADQQYSDGRELKTTLSQSSPSDLVNQVQDEVRLNWHAPHRHQKSSAETEKVPDNTDKSASATTKTVTDKPAQSTADLSLRRTTERLNYGHFATSDDGNIQSLTHVESVRPGTSQRINMTSQPASRETRQKTPKQEHIEQVTGDNILAVNWLVSTPTTSAFSSQGSSARFRLRKPYPPFDPIGSLTTGNIADLMTTQGNMSTNEQISQRGLSTTASLPEFAWSNEVGNGTESPVLIKNVTENATSPNPGWPFWIDFNNRKRKLQKGTTRASQGPLQETPDPAVHQQCEQNEDEHTTDGLWIGRDGWYKQPIPLILFGIIGVQLVVIAIQLSQASALLKRRQICYALDSSWNSFVSQMVRTNHLIEKCNHAETLRQRRHDAQTLYGSAFDLLGDGAGFSNVSAHL